MNGGDERSLDHRSYTGKQIHGLQPIELVEKIIRERILESLYYKEQCFALNAATLLDRASEIKNVGGQYSNQRPTEFLCLAFKLLQIQPDREIVITYLDDEEWKYLRCLAAFYIRLTFPAADVYTLLEPYLVDYRKVKRRTQWGWELTYVDDFVDDLLVKERVCDIALPRLPARGQLEDEDKLAARISAIASELDSDENSSESESQSE